MVALKLMAIPAVIWLASWAGRRWGHRASGMISGFPVISGPLLLFVSLDAPRAFVADTAWTTMSASPAVGVHCLVYAWLARLIGGRRLDWAICLAGAWAAYLGAALAFSAMGVQGAFGAAIAIGQMVLASALMPRSDGQVGVPRIPAAEIVVRMLAAVLIAAAVMLGGQSFGTRVSGILLAFPITASVLPVFTLALYGAQATARLLAGFVTGLIGFVSYFYAFAALVESAGPALACVAGIAASLVAVSLVLGWQSRGRSHKPGTG
jgi:hypothetical protein